MAQREQEAEVGKEQRVERMVKSVERFMVVLGVAVLLLILSYNIAQQSNLGFLVLIIGFCLILVLVLIEILLIERHRHPSS